MALNDGRRWLVTGGCGFIGTRLIRNLVAEGGHYLRVLDDLSVGTSENLGRVCDVHETAPEKLSLNPSPQSGRRDKCDLIVGNILDFDLALKVSEGMDVVVHLAANTGVLPSVKDPRQDMVINVSGTFNMLEAARQNRVKHFIFASSGAPIGECRPPIHEEIAPHPVSPYGASKLAGEGYCSAYYRTFGLATVVLRFGNVYGPGSSHKSSVIAKFIRRSLEREVCHIYGDGTQTRDFIYIDDLIEAIRKASGADAGGEIFQIATNEEHTVNEVADIIAQVLKESHSIDMQTRYSAQRPGDVKRNFSDTSKARNSLGWSAKTELKAGITNTVEWFSKYRQKK